MDSLTWALAAAVVLLAAGLVAVLVRTRVRKVQATELTRWRDAFMDVSEKSNDAIFVVDIADGRIHYGNPAAAELLGYPVEALKRLTVFQLHPPDLLQDSAETISRVWEEGGLIYEHLPMLRADGESLPVECSGKVIQFLDRPTILLNVRDIRERRRLQAEILRQKDEIEEKNHDIIDSITHARRIQTALLVPPDRIRAVLPNSFVFYVPKDIVSGDFYFFQSLGSQYVLAAVDCTGHGVPGAFMSVVGYTKLNEVIRDFLAVGQVLDPGEVLGELDVRIRAFLGQDGTSREVKDGMDVCLTVVHAGVAGLEVAFAGAYRPLFAVQHGELHEYKGSKYPVGGYVDGAKTFETHRLTLAPGDAMYLFSDGIVDQFGGPQGRKYGSGQLRELLVSVAGLPSEAQAARIRSQWEAWRGNRAQLDDVMLLGVVA